MLSPTNLTNPLQTTDSPLPIRTLLMTDLLASVELTCSHPPAATSSIDLPPSIRAMTELVITSSPDPTMDSRDPPPPPTSIDNPPQTRIDGDLLPTIDHQLRDV